MKHQSESGVRCRTREWGSIAPPSSRIRAQSDNPSGRDGAELAATAGVTQIAEYAEAFGLLRGTA